MTSHKTMKTTLIFPCKQTKIILRSTDVESVFTILNEVSDSAKCEVRHRDLLIRMLRSISESTIQNRPIPGLDFSQDSILIA